MAATDIHIKAPTKDQPKGEDASWLTICGLPGEERVVADPEIVERGGVAVEATCPTCLGKPEEEVDEEEDASEDLIEPSAEEKSEMEAEDEESGSIANPSGQPEEDE